MANTPQSVAGTLNLSSGLSAVVLHGPVHDSKFLQGRIDLNGAATKISHYYRSIGGSISLSGGAVKKTGKSLVGTTSLVGALAAGESNTERPSGVLSFTSMLIKEVGKSTTGDVSLSSNVAGGFGVSKALSGDLALTGTLENGRLGGTLGLTGTLVKKVNKSLSGALAVTGTWAGGPALPLSGTLWLNREASLNLTGDLLIDFVISRALSGTLSLNGELDNARPSGELSLTGDVIPVLHAQPRPEGTLSLTGTLTTNRSWQQAIEGRLSFMKVLTSTVYYDVGDVSLLNLAASDDIIIEQGISFQRKYRWMKSDGLPFDLSDFTLNMVIKHTYDTIGNIADSNTNISITKSGVDVGVFQIDITNEKTAVMDFTRAVFMITASWSTYVTKLVAGNVVLVRSLAKHADSNVSGTISFTGGVTTAARGKATSGTLRMTGAVSAVKN